ncbi:ABC transporter permease [Dactylosporangium sp. NPDC049140]|uniref:YhgE/Pip domain-containing protein n=1 Tax=Dactylosporangium sp. NPDC049140 TaxID=3155647 RepID=UPI0033D6BF2E
MIILLSLALPACYLSGITDPQANVRRLPVALVAGPQREGGALDGTARSVADAVRTGTDQEKIRIIAMSPAEMATAMRDNAVYGAVVIPEDFDHALAGLVTATPGTVPARPVVSIVTNAGAGNLAAGLVNGAMSPVLAAVQHSVAERLGVFADPYRALVLREPFAVRTVPDRVLPPRSGSGLTPFYLALVTILIGFIGASTIHPAVDAAIGFAPSEVGPFTTRRRYRPASRTTTLLAKLAVLLAVAPIAAALLNLTAARVIGVPMDHPLVMWLLLTSAITAVGIGALSVFAVFGSPGALVNTFFFVAMSLATGPSVPTEALPAWLRACTSITAMPPILDGVRAVLFFDGRGAAGLTDGWTHIAVGATVGLALGLTTTWWYDRNPRLSRHPAEAEATAGALLRR